MACEPAIDLRVEANLEMGRLDRLVTIEMTENLQGVRDAHVKGVRFERLLEQGPGLLFASHAHVKESQTCLCAGERRPELSGFLVAGFGFGESAALGQLVRENEIEDPGLRVLALHLLDE